MQRVAAKICAFILSALVILAPLAPAHGQTSYVRFAIPAKPMGEAMIDFAVQARLSVSISGVDFGRSLSKPLFGTFQKDDALRRLLAGSDFAFEYLDTDTVRIRRRTTEHARPATPPGVETVLVTATKREALVQDLPYAISAVSGRQLSDFGVKSTHGLTLEAAGLTATNLGSGEDKLFVRGLTDSIVPGLSESVVGVYLDDARIVDDAPDPDLELVDVSRVEVLRGPQGTLYGAGSLTGLVRIVTNKPDFSSRAAMLESTLASTEGGGLSWGTDGMLNLPLIPNRVAVRAVGYEQVEGGYIDEIRLGKTNTNRTTKKGGRVQLGWQPAAMWTVIASFALQGTQANDSQYALETLGGNKRDNLLLEPHSDNFVQGGLTIDGSLAGADLVSNTSFVGRQLTDRFDASYAWPQLTGFPLGPSPFDYARKIQSFTHETRLSSVDEGRWKWVAGLFLAHRDEDFSSQLSGPDNFGATFLARAEQREDRQNEAALFGEATYDLTSALSITGGLRVFDSNRITTDRGAGPLFTSPNVFTGNNGQAGVAPKAVIEFRPNANMTFYAQAAEGYRQGDLSVGNPGTAGGQVKFQSDELWNYELGSKFDLLDHRLTVDAALYYVDWNNVQADQISPVGAFYTLNAGTVHDLGLETEFAWRPLDGLVLRGNLFWNSTSLSNKNPVLVGGEGELPGAPDATADISARYDFSIGRSSGAFASVDYSYVGVSHLGFGEATPSMGGYRLTNVRLGLERGPWQLALFANNLANDRGNTFAFGNPFDLARSAQITPPRPRTFGLTLTWSR